MSPLNLPSSGRVEVLYNGTWGTICDYSWGLLDANVACRRQLGYDGALSTLGFAAFGQGTGPLWLDNVRCFGNEKLTSQCSHWGWGFHYCDYTADAGVVCKLPVRVVSPTNSPSSGRVEILQNGTWGTICDHSWNLQDADVVCRQLGYDTALSANGPAAFGQGSGQIWLGDVKCAGNESSLSQCSHKGLEVHNCGHSEHVGVKCGPRVRLISPTDSPSFGRVEVLYGGTWRTICDDSLDLHDANVICRQLGYDGASSAPLEICRIRTKKWSDRN